MITIKTDLHKLYPYLDTMKKNVVKAHASALNKTAAQTFTQAKKELTGSYAIKSSDVGRVVKVYKASINKLTAAIKAVDAQLGFSNVAARIRSAKWKATANRSGKKVRTEIKKGNKTAWAHAFIAKMPSGHIGLFERTGNKRIINGKKQQPIKEIKGPSISYLFGSAGIMDKLSKFAQDKFPSIFSHEYEYFNKK